MAQYVITYRDTDPQTGQAILARRTIEADSRIDASNKAGNFGIPRTEISNVSVIPAGGSIGTPFIGEQPLGQVQAMRTDTAEEGSFGRTADMFPTQAAFQSFVNRTAQSEAAVPEFRDSPSPPVPPFTGDGLPVDLVRVVTQAVEGIEDEGTTNVFRKLIGQKRASDGSLYRLYAYGLSEEQVNAGGIETIAFLVQGGKENDFTQAFNNEVAVTPETYQTTPNILDLNTSDIIGYGTSTDFFRKGGDSNNFITINAFARKNYQEEAKVPEWYVEVNRLNGRAEVENRTEDGNIVYSFGQGLTSDEMSGLGIFQPGSPPSPLPETADIVTNFEAPTFGEGAPVVADDTGGSNGIDNRASGNNGGNIVTNVDPAGGSMSEILSSYGIDVGPFGVIAEDMPGLPPDFFDRDDYYVDVTTVTRDVNPLFNRTEDTYQTSDAGFRIDSTGQPEYLESITINREINPEIDAALEAYRLALQAKTNLSGSLAQVLSTHINATEGLGVGKDAFTAPEIANLRQNLALISATEGLVTYDSEGERQINEALQQARLQEITAAQRPDVQRQLVDLYSNPVAYGILTSTQEGQDFLNNLQQQATFTPFPTEMQQRDGAVIQNLGMGAAPTTTTPLGGAPATSEEAFYIPPSARDFVTADEMQRGRMIAGAAGAGIYGENALEREIAERTPFGTTLSSSYLAPFTLGSGTTADPFSGAQRGS